MTNPWGTSLKPRHSAEEICDDGNDDLLFLKGKLRIDRQGQYLCCGALTLRKGPGGVSQATQRWLLMQGQGVVNLRFDSPGVEKGLQFVAPASPNNVLMEDVRSLGSGFGEDYSFLRIRPRLNQPRLLEKYLIGLS